MWNWRAHLRPRERELIERSDQALQQIEVLNLEIQKTNRNAIIDRAVERARYAGDRAESGPW